MLDGLTGGDRYRLAKLNNVSVQFGEVASWRVTVSRHRNYE